MYAWVYVLLALVVIGGLVFLILRRRAEKFSQCVCSSGGAVRRYCQNVDQVWDEYEKGRTEYADYPSRGWSRTSPGDRNYPVSVDCAWPNSIGDQDADPQTMARWNKSAFNFQV